MSLIQAVLSSNKTGVPFCPGGGAVTVEAPDAFALSRVWLSACGPTF